MILNRNIPTDRIRHLIITVKIKEQSTRMSVHMLNRSRVMLSRCHSHIMCFCVDAGSEIEKIQDVR